MGLGLFDPWQVPPGWERFVRFLVFVGLAALLALLGDWTGCAWRADQ